MMGHPLVDRAGQLADEMAAAAKKAARDAETAATDFRAMLTKFAASAKPEEEIRARIEAEDRDARLAAAVRSLARFTGFPARWTADTFDASHWPGLPGLFADAANPGTDPACVLFIGPTDTGKSHAGAALARMHARAGRTIYGTSEPELAAFVDANKYNGQEMERLKNDMIGADVLLYDDAGKVELARGLQLSPVGAIVFDVMDKRAQRRRACIVTTRYSSEQELAGVIGADLLRRFLQIERRERTARNRTLFYSEKKV